MVARSPLFSVVTPVYDPPTDALRAMIASVVDQTDPDLELILVDDRSTRDEVRETLREAAAQDDRVRVIERAQGGGIVAASNDAIAAARGEFLALVDHDDLLVPEALATMRAAIDAHPDVDYLYSDEDKLGADGELYDRDRKPDWSPERLRGHMYPGHLSVLRTRVVREVGGFRARCEGSQDHDLVLRVTEIARRVHHVRSVLYHWRVVPGSAAGEVGAKPYAWDAGVRAVQDHLERTGVPGEATKGWLTSTYRVRRSTDPRRLVSVVIATDGSGGRVWGQDRVWVTEAVRSLVARAGHPRIEIVVVHTKGTPAAVLADLKAIGGDRVRAIPAPAGIGHAAMVNHGVLCARGSWLVLLDQQTEVISDDLIVQLVAPLDEDDVGAVGARILQEDGRLWHAGWIHRDGTLVPYARGWRPQEHGPFAALQVAREVTAMSGVACGIRREVFLEAGGLNENRFGPLSGLDLSLKLRAAGRRLVWQPEATLYRLGPEATAEPDQWTQLDVRWGLDREDPYLPDDR
ncbi:glycosyltransferase [Cellulomonas sp. RIT-PI-Y]|uniref:glycosyltransferase family 2 protein n=1 Tax=Cellulomonas sp. RIT-PI-Y TaxID=3035297 RepID=UPI0021D7F682|nr:glycosyltransferase [Cellulomonas sp. RIT-PI-Y]